MKNLADTMIQVPHHQPLGQELVKSKKIIDQFIYGCSHSFRAPLKSMAGLIYLLRDSLGTSSDSSKYVELIQESVFKMEVLLNELEEFLENSRVELRIEPINLEQEICTSLREFETELTVKNINVSINVDQPVEFYSDRSRLNQILHHLISNAVVFDDQNKEKKAIDILVKANLSGCTIKIHDNGLGMTDEVRANIFKLFYRGTEKSVGCGMGLYIVEELLKKMNGSIFVTSRLNVGSDFFVWLPNRFS